ncbi:alpha/beta hydrolase [Brumimicrobium oceani]|uniref:Phospholipase n=1 Tax=Brumimicrobium oceani TaxID=2100725 RepID=A0A2U2X288_9FLAO|nr:phospholipase [Brumimicrobium oceani]PWH81895.1 phospholipase [Brumimicrobium oceani]
MEHKISISKTARYYTYGNPETADNIWIVLHGYSQLAEFFIRKFHQLNPNKNFIVAPEGFHRFYRKGTSGRVGASWMTKVARLDDIEDNHNYLNQLGDALLSQYDFKQRFLLGFSQGGATASRWHNNGNFNADHFILWASVFPNDISIEEGTNGMMHSNNYFVVGDDDEYFQGKMEEVNTFFEEQNFETKIKNFKGVHDIHNDTLLEIAEECIFNRL